MSDKPREWNLFGSGLSGSWLVQTDTNTPIVGEDDQYVLVIEYSAYEKLKAELAESEALCETMREMYEYGYESKTMHSAIVENEKLKAENERLKEELTEAERQYSNGVEFLNETAEERDTLKAKLAEVEAENAQLKRGISEVTGDKSSIFIQELNARYILPSDVAEFLDREREAAKVMREALDRAKQFCAWLSRPWYLLTESTDAVDAARLELVSIVDAIAKADEIRGDQTKMPCPRND